MCDLPVMIALSHLSALGLMRTLLFHFGCATLALNLVVAVRADDAFRSQVAPILERRCVRCHGGAKPKGDVDLSSAAGVAKTDGLIVAGRPEQSLLIDVV